MFFYINLYEIQLLDTYILIFSNDKTIKLAILKFIIFYLNLFYCV